ncbi:peptidoglycan recognition protein family protein [Alkalibacillus almallahensis]|uniref:peptidoglycan recognition protein family protein n=1 Tax=Alkalibacillus almallahensis TaxID=1379154 RepID=UPI0014238A40|nr:peptidoglycan-binding protein [Alkalibacillus almallahensis]NIK12748.1 peptidoglycan hydrolase-like protein with peptidoglycan-binding domain [Alkalibacillus almallahensis]
MTITKDTVLKSGDSGEDVILLQQALVNNNFYPNIDADNNGVDGIYGPSTEDAVRRFQIVHELTVDGIAGPSTLSSLGLIDGNSGEISESTVLSPGNSGESVRVLQQALVDNNFYPNIDAENNGVDGIYGPNTEDAVRRYQIMNGLTVDGIAGSETLTSLGLEARTSPEEEDDTGSVDFIGGDLGDISISQVFIPTLNYNRPGYSMFPRYITIHETANTAPGATAFMHSNYVQNPSTLSSWHFTVDDSRVIYQHLPTNESGFHAGDGSGDGNRNSIGIELCVNNGGDFVQTRRNAAVLVRKLMRDYNIPIYNVVTHNHWSGKFCPANMLEHFESFRTQVKRSTLPEPEPADYYTITSPFGDSFEFIDKDATTGVSYSTAYDISFGPLSGQLEGEIILGDPKNVEWSLDLDEDPVIIETDTFKNEIDNIFEEMIHGIKEELLPGYDEVTEARAELDLALGNDIDKVIEARMSSFDFNWGFSTDFPYIADMDYLTLEVLFEVQEGVHAKEKLVFNDIDWKRNPNGTLASALVLLLIAVLFSSLVAKGIIGVSVLRAVIRELSRTLGRTNIFS